MGDIITVKGEKMNNLTEEKRLLSSLGYVKEMGEEKSVIY